MSDALSQRQEVSQRRVSVSIIVPFFNAERFLKESIDSVLAQTVSDWELILVDDGSQDGSRDIVNAFLRVELRAICVEHVGRVNRGTSASRNLGLRSARGEFVAFLDADDVWDPKFLEYHQAILSAHPKAGMTYGPGRWWFSWTGDPADLGRDYAQNLGVLGDRIITPPALVDLFLKDEGAVPSPSGVMMRRETLEDIGGWDVSFPGMYDDQVLYVKIGLGKEVFVSAKCLYRYRQRSDSLCSSSLRDGTYYRERERFLEWCSGYLGEHPLPNDGLAKDVRFRLWLNRFQGAFRSNVPTRLLQRWPNKVLQIVTVLGALLRQERCRSVYSRLARHVVLRLRWRVQAMVGAAATHRHCRIFGARMSGLSPVSRMFGLDRGLPIDRYFIEKFLNVHEADISGRVMEIGNNTYTRQFGGTRVTRSDVLHALPGNANATLVGDLTTGTGIPHDAFDCIILTQTLPFLYDVLGAVRGTWGALKPDGVVLATFAGISQISRYDMDRWGDFWRFTDASARRLFGDVFGGENIRVETFGNVLVACAFLRGLAAHELAPEELDYHDPDYQVLITVRAVKRSE